MHLMETTQFKFPQKFFFPLGKNNLSNHSLLSLLFLRASLSRLPRQVSTLELMGSPCLTSLVDMTLGEYHRLGYAFS